MFVGRAPWVAILALVAIVLAAGCGSSSSSGSGSSIGKVQLVNGVIDSPQLWIEISDADGDVIESVSSFDFQQASALLSLARGQYEIDIYYEDPDTGFEERLLSSDLDVHRNTIYLGVLSGTFANSQLDWYEKDDSDITDSEDELELQAVNLSSESVSVYLGDTSQGLNDDTLVATIASGVVSDPVTLEYDDDADYHVRVTADGSSDLSYDSGEISVSESTRSTFFVTDSTGPDSEGHSVFIVRDSSTLTFPNELAQAGFRVINGVSDAAQVQVTVTVSATGEVLFDQLLTPDEVSTPVVVSPDFVDVEAVVDGVTTLSATVSLSADEGYSIIVAGSVVEDDLSIRANTLDSRVVANAINLHFINALPETDDEDISEVDFYALPLGESLSETAPEATGVNYLEGVSFTIGATAYDLVVTTSGTLSILAGPARIFPAGGERVIAVALEAAGGGRPYRVELTVEED